MSWSMNLKGGKKFVLREMEDASAVIDRARYALQMEDDDVFVTVSCSGHAYSSPDGTGGAGASFSMGTYLPPPPPEPPQAEEALPMPVDQQVSSI